MPAPDLRAARWIKSSHSTNNGECVEVAFGPQRVAARDSKDPDGGALRLSPEAFRAFLHRVRG
ncbi:DUF397 domain-containing protein [Amycolatopsis aidingensis]|uniref:DUF397 domain-containing protein n=1 Tax=Amycolatopsis aidingensis TaxID=2842453 RepID=UPI001E58EE7C|nr:DUF397 domain-containing protein [Amycolatopsis aidingensis]